MIAKRFMAVVIVMSVLGVSQAGKVVPAGATTTTEMTCATDPMPPISDVPWNSTREHPGQPY
jgi:hypothetical protein